MYTWLRSIYYSFAVQLLLLHLRSNLLLLALWVALALLVTGRVGARLGLSYLFLDPEYLGQVGFASFYFLGLAYGGFFMSWNLATYLLTAHHFPFLASLSRPFTKFSINNMLLPLLFLALYLVVLLRFEYDYLQLPQPAVAQRLAGLLGGALSTIVGYALYFQLTNRDIGYYQKRAELPPQQTIHYAPGYRDVDLDYIKLDQNRIPVRTYLTEGLRPRLVRSVAHYESKLLLNIFRQNHLNALLLQLLTLLLLLALGYLIDYHWFRIPAGASIFILFSVLIAGLGALTYWFRTWRVLVIVSTLALTNYISTFPAFNHPNRAYGLNYTDAPPATYSYAKLQEVCESEQVANDRAHTEAILQRWRLRVASLREKPKLVVVCVSGGGLRSAVWSMQVAQTADSLLNGRFLNHTVLITGASGGMLGMAYLRELHLRQQLGEKVKPWSDQHIDFISRDMLNSVAFTIVTNDLFLPWSTFQVGRHTYPKDRGYMFEQQFNENTRGVLNKTLADYREPEARALIPMLFLTPSIVNDGRQLVISPQPVSYLMRPPQRAQSPNQLEVDAVDFGWLLHEQGADSLRFLTALRMNSTYPYVLPNVHLPTQPRIEVVDAGFRDNYGVMTAARFLQVFRTWIRQNTSGVVLVQISSSEKFEQIIPSDHQGWVDAWFNPLGIAGKVFTVQEFAHDNVLGYLTDLLGPDQFEVLRFVYRPSDENHQRASISFHLTVRERQDVKNSIYLPENQEVLKRLQQLLSE